MTEQLWKHSSLTHTVSTLNNTSMETKERLKEKKQEVLLAVTKLNQLNEHETTVEEKTDQTLKLHVSSTEGGSYKIKAYVPSGPNVP